MDLAILAVLVACVVGFLVLASRRASEEQRALADRVALRHGGVLASTRFAAATARFRRQGEDLGVYFTDGADGPYMGVLVFPDRPLPLTEPARVVRVGPRRLADLAEKGDPPPRTGDAAFDKEFRIEAGRIDLGPIGRWLDETGRKLVRELARYQDDRDLPVLECWPGDGAFWTWRPGHETGETEVDLALELATRTARRLTGGEPMPAAAPAALEV